MPDPAVEVKVQYRYQSIHVRFIMYGTKSLGAKENRGWLASFPGFPTPECGVWEPGNEASGWYVQVNIVSFSTTWERLGMRLLSMVTEYKVVLDCTIT